MTDWRKAGQLADARRVAILARDNYQSPAKKALRRWVVETIASCSPSLVLDLWGGGESADAMTDAGLSVLSIDDGRGFKKKHAISTPRAKRALRLCAEAKGYAWDWGASSLVRNAHRCEAAWLDFMGHLSPAAIKAIEACAHMKVVVITVMPERVDVGQGIPLDYWCAMYVGAVRLALPNAGRVMTRRYRRPSGQWALVIVAVRRGISMDRTKGRIRQGIVTRHRERMETDPEFREKTRTYHRDRAREKYRSDHDAVRARQREYVRRRYASDPAFRAKVKDAVRRWEQNLSPERREERAERRRQLRRERYAADPAYRERRKAIEAAHRERKRAFVSQEAAA